MNAKEARENTINQIKESLDYRVAMDQIENAIKQGKFFIEIEAKYVGEATIDVLTVEDGYTVYTYNNNIKITW